MDKWFTDLAAHSEADCVTVDYWPTHTDKFQVTFWDQTADLEDSGTGKTLDEAMKGALTKRKQRLALETLAAIDGELL